MGIAADLVLIVVAGVVGGLVAHRLGQPLLVGYILAGIAVGPHTAGPTVVEIHDIELLAEIGVALLLFALGLELRFGDLVRVRRLALIGGPIQILLTGALGALFAESVLGWERTPAIWMGAMVSLSSTMVVLKLLLSTGKADAIAGRAMIGLLVVQDLAVAPMLIVLPRLGDMESAFGDVALTFLRAGLFLVAMIFIGTRLIPFLLRRIVRWESRELFMISIVALGVGVGYGTYLFGLSFAFGSFVAGMVMSESEFSHQALGDIVPLRDVFGLLFFASAGMLFDPRYLLADPAVVFAAIVFVVVVKAGVCGSLAWMFGRRGVEPWIVGLGLAQMGEFSFLLARTGISTGGISQDHYALALTVALATMVLSPALFRVATPLHQIAWRLFPGQIPPAPVPAATGDTTDHTVIIGYGRTGRPVAEIMRQIGVPFAVIELDHALSDVARTLGHSVVWGDASRPEVLAAARAAKARLVLIAVHDISLTRAVVDHMKRVNPNAVLIGSARDPAELAELARFGIHEVVQPELEAGLEMARQVLIAYDKSPVDIQTFSDVVREEMYGPIREGGLSKRYAEILSDLGTSQRAATIEWIKVPSARGMAERSIGELEIRGRSGATVLATARGRSINTNPGPETRIRGGDRIAVLGTLQQRRSARDLLAGPWDDYTTP